MAEIRKHNPEAGNAIAQALRAAMGEPVRPNEPGARPTPVASPTGPTISTTTVNFSISTTSAPAADPEDD